VIFRINVTLLYEGSRFQRREERWGWSQICLLLEGWGLSWCPKQWTFLQLVLLIDMLHTLLKQAHIVALKQEKDNYTVQTTNLSSAISREWRSRVQSTVL